MIDSVFIPEGRRGPWAVKRFAVTAQQSAFASLRAAINGGRGAVPAGKYTQLVHDRRGLVMSDTPDEKRDHYEAVYRAKGHVLINGLGLGMVLTAILKKPDVSRVTIVEIDEDVIGLVGSHFSDERLTIVHDSAFLYQPPKGERFGAVWHDIWDNICTDNLPEMTRLKRRYGRRADWQGCWSEAQCRREMKNWRRSAWR